MDQSYIILQKMDYKNKILDYILKKIDIEIDINNKENELKKNIKKLEDLSFYTKTIDIINFDINKLESELFNKYLALEKLKLNLVNPE